MKKVLKKNTGQMKSDEKLQKVAYFIFCLSQKGRFKNENLIFIEKKVRVPKIKMFFDNKNGD